MAADQGAGQGVFVRAWAQAVKWAATAAAAATKRRSHPPHRRSGPVHPPGHPAVACAGGGNRQRLTDHRHGVDPSSEGHIRHEDLGLSTRAAPAPAGTEHDRASFAPKGPDPGEGPPGQPPAARRAGHHAGRQISLDHRRIVLYDDHDALRHHREDPLVLRLEISEGVLARSGTSSRCRHSADTASSHSRADVLSLKDA